MAKSKAEPRQQHKMSESTQNLLAQVQDLVGTTDERVVGTLQRKAGRWKPEEIISSGSLEIDLAIGIGGIPRGKIIEIFGAESCGKSTISQLIMANAQKQGLMGVYIDSEHALDPTYATTLGVDLDNMLTFRPENLEQALDLIKGLCDQGYDGLIVLDSIPNTLPKSMMEASAEDEGRRAAAAAVYTRMMPVIKKAVSDSNATLFMVNQTRSTMATQPWEKKEDTPGGKMLKYTYDLRLEVKKSLDSAERRSDEGTTYAEIAVQCVKNKFSAPFKRGRFILRDNIGIDPFEDAVNAAMRPDVAMIHEGWKIDEGEMQSKKGWRLWLLSDEDGEMLARATATEDPETNELSYNTDFVRQVEVVNGDGELKLRWIIQAHQNKNFMALLEDHEELVTPLLREAILNTLAREDDDEDDEGSDDE